MSLCVAERGLGPSKLGSLELRIIEHGNYIAFLDQVALFHLEFRDDGRSPSGSRNAEDAVLGFDAAEGGDLCGIRLRFAGRRRDRRLFSRVRGIVSPGDRREAEGRENHGKCQGSLGTQAVEIGSNGEHREILSQLNSRSDGPRDRRWAGPLSLRHGPSPGDPYNGRAMYRKAREILSFAAARRLREWRSASAGLAAVIGMAVLLAACEGGVPAAPPSGLANPASVNCGNVGGELQIEKNGAGAEYGVCVFEDNRQCEEWALLRGDCPGGGLRITGYITPASRYCAIQGGTYSVTHPAGATTPERGSCELPGGERCAAERLFDGRCS